VKAPGGQSLEELLDRSREIPYVMMGNSPSTTPAQASAAVASPAVQRLEAQLGALSPRFSGASSVAGSGKSKEMVQSSLAEDTVPGPAVAGIVAQVLGNANARAPPEVMSNCERNLAATSLLPPHLSQGAAHEFTPIVGPDGSVQC